MRTHRRPWLLLTVLTVGGLALSPGGSALAQEPRAADDASREERADRLLAPFDRDDAPGVIVAVVEGGEITYLRARGMADPALGVPLGVATRMNIGSTAKQFTAFAVVRLAHEGTLSLDDDVREYLPELPDLGEAVTLRHLLTHTSGYRELLNALAIGGWRLEESDYFPREEAVTVVQRQPRLQNSPGAEWNYNNTGYALVSMVIERVTGEPFHEWMRTRVFEPAGMVGTRVRAHPLEVVPGAARGFAPDVDGFREAPDVGATMGAGSVYATVEDLARWMAALGSEAGTHAAAIEEMTRRFVLTTGAPVNYGLGLQVDEQRGLRRVHHGGADIGFQSHFLFYPDADGGLIVLTNNAGFPASVPAALVDIFFGEHMEPVDAPAGLDEPAAGFDPDAFDPARFDRFAGRYELEIQPGFVLSFRREGDRLITQATGQPAVSITPTSDSTFSLVGVQASVTFHTNERGEVTGLTLHQNGNHAAHRLPDDTGAEPVDLTLYAGRYYSAEFENFYEIEPVDGGLLVTQRRRDPTPLTHSEGDVFVGPFPLLEVVFERDDSGRVVGLVASNMRTRDVRFERVR